MLRALFFVMGSFVLVRSFDAAFSQDSFTADLVIVNGQLFGAADKAADSIAISDRRIVRLGVASEMESLVGRQTVRLDARKATITPSFNDAHVHFLSGGLSKRQVDLSNCASLEQIKLEIQRFRMNHPESTLLQGRGWVYGAFPDGLPSRQQLDEIVPDIPAVLKCYDGHTSWVNSKALHTANVGNDTIDPPGGTVVRDPETREPTGVLKESAMELVNSIIPKPTRQEKLTALRDAIREAHRYGVTSIQEAGASEEVVDLFEQLRRTGELELRVYIALEGKADMQTEELERLETIRKKYSQLRIGAVKLYVDGVVESHTAAMLAPYANRDSAGHRECTPEALNSIVQALDSRGWQIMTHAIGDGGIRMTLDAYEHAHVRNASNASRHRIEHLETIDPRDVSRIATLGVIASMQPFHANPNNNIFNVWAVNLGPQRTKNAWQWKSILDQHGNLAFGTDWPVVNLDPRPGLHVALTRQTLDRKPADGFLPDQRMSLAQAITAYTAGSAYAEFQEAEKGLLREGMLADLVVWDRDLTESPQEKITQSRIRYTIYDGRIVYEER